MARPISAAKRQWFYRQWFALLNAFVDSGQSQLTRSELAVYLILLRDTRPDGTARAALTDLARRGGISKRSASRAIQALIGRGTVRVVKPGVVGKPTLYTLLPPDAFQRLNPIAAKWIEESNSLEP